MDFLHLLNKVNSAITSSIFYLNPPDREYYKYCRSSEPFGHSEPKTKRYNSLFQGLIRASSEASTFPSNWSGVVTIGQILALFSCPFLYFTTEGTWTENPCVGSSILSRATMKKAPSPVERRGFSVSGSWFPLYLPIGSKIH